MRSLPTCGIDFLRRPVGRSHIRDRDEGMNGAHLRY